jgi:hypothetical protein
MLDTLTIDMFAARLGERFRVRVAEHTLETELIHVTPLQKTRKDGGDAAGHRVPFSLIFRGPRQVVLPQQIYPVEHDAMGTLEIFLVPIGPDQAGMCYEAIFT